MDPITSPNPNRVCVAIDFGDKLEVIARLSDMKEAIGHVRGLAHGDYVLLTMNKAIKVGPPANVPAAVVTTTTSFAKPRGPMSPETIAKRQATRNKSKAKGGK